MAGSVSGLLPLIRPGNSFVVDDMTCRRCGGVSVTDVINLCLQCFYETDRSFHCNGCGFHEIIVEGLYHFANNQMCDECSIEYITSYREDDIAEVVREISRLERGILKFKEQKVAMSCTKES